MTYADDDRKRDRLEVESRFAYHQPRYGSSTGDFHANVRAMFRRVAYSCVDLVEPSRARSLALTALEEGMHWMNSAVALEGAAGLHGPEPSAPAEPSCSCGSGLLGIIHAPVCAMYEVVPEDSLSASLSNAISHLEEAAGGHQPTEATRAGRDDGWYGPRTETGHAANSNGNHISDPDLCPKCNEKEPELAATSD